MRKKPFRKDNDISQTYCSGTVKIYTATDTAQPGYQPKIKLSEQPKYVIPFEERALGINRIYLSKSAKAEILRVIRVPRVDISPHDVAVTHDGKIYDISTVQMAADVLPPSWDLSLKRLEHTVEVVPK